MTVEVNLYHPRIRDSIIEKAQFLKHMQGLIMVEAGWLSERSALSSTRWNRLGQLSRHYLRDSAEASHEGLDLAMTVTDRLDVQGAANLLAGEAGETLAWMARAAAAGGRQRPAPFAQFDRCQQGAAFQSLRHRRRQSVNLRKSVPKPLAVYLPDR